MNLRSWLKQNFLRRGLRWLCERAQRELFSSIQSPSLLTRIPWHWPRQVTSTSTGVPTTPDSCERTLLKDGRRLDVVSDENISLNRDYVDWIAPLNSLPNNVTIDQLKQFVHALPNYNQQGQYFFPSDAYLAATQSHRGLAVQFIHRCRVERAGKEFKNDPNLSGLASAQDDPAAMLIYERPSTFCN